MWQLNFMEGSESRVCLAHPTSHVGMLQNTSIPSSAAYELYDFRRINNYQ